MPYKQTLHAGPAETAPDGVTCWTDPKGLCSAASERPAGGLTQRSECDPYKVEVAGSNPAAPTTPDITAELLAILKELMAWHDCQFTRNICDIQDDAKRLIAEAEVRS